MGTFLQLVAFAVSVYAALTVAGQTTSWLLVFAVFIGVFAAGVLLWYLTIGMRRATVYERALAQWQRSWLCMKCGHGFAADGTIESTRPA